MERAFGPKAAGLFVPNPAIDEYAAVLCFPDTKVVVSGELSRALRKVAGTGPILIIAGDLTIEARRVAGKAGSDVITKSEFGWTDASYQDIRQRY